MPTLPDLTNRLILWLKANPTTPPLREYALTAALPHGAYPALAVLPAQVRFAPNRRCASATLTLRLAACAGRPVDALTLAQELAGQLKHRLEASQNLGGLARSVQAGEWRLLQHNGSRSRQARAMPAVPEPLFVQLAELELRTLFNF
jgi:hypothetical protein